MVFSYGPGHSFKATAQSAFTTRSPSNYADQTVSWLLRDVESACSIASLYPDFSNHSGADKSLARPRSKQATFPHILWNLKVHYHIHKSPPTALTLAKSIRSSALHSFEFYYRGADKSLARPGRKQVTFPAFYGTWRFITASTTAHHLSLP